MTANQIFPTPQPASARPLSVSFAISLIALYGVISLLALPVANIAGPEIPFLTDVFVAVLFATEFSTAALFFFGPYQKESWAFLLLGCAYLYSSLMAVAHLLTFPGAITPGKPFLATVPQAVGWIFVLWVSGYAVLTFLAVLAEVVGFERQPRRRSLIVTLFAAAAVGASLISVLLAGRLPPLVLNQSWTGLNHLIVAAAMLLLCVSIALVLLVVKTELFLWLGLAMTAVVCANLVSETGGGRYTLGWSFSRLSWMVSALCVFAYLVRRLPKLKG